MLSLASFVDSLLLLPARALLGRLAEVYYSPKLERVREQKALDGRILLHISGLLTLIVAVKILFSVQNFVLLPKSIALSYSSSC